jgi:hypothetical protein
MVVTVIKDLNESECTQCCCPCDVSMAIALVGGGTCTSPSGSGLSWTPDDCDGEDSITLTQALAGSTSPFPRQTGGTPVVVTITAPDSITCNSTEYVFSHWQISGCLESTSGFTPETGDPTPDFYCYYETQVPIPLCSEDSCDVSATAYYDLELCEGFETGTSTQAYQDICDYIDDEPDAVECPPA